MTGPLDAVFADIDRNAERHIDRLRDLIRRPSRTGHLDEVSALADHLAQRLSADGWAAKSVPIEWLAPVVFAKWPAPPGGKTLLAYCHYDVISPEPVDEWEYPPFSAHRVGGKIFGRGSTDAKANLLALVAAIETLAEVNGQAPIGMKLILDGDEERGSPGIPLFIDEHESELSADAALSFDGAVDATGVPKIGMGTGGMVAVELRCDGAPYELHSAKSPLFVNPAWRLIWALASIKGPDERVLLDGFEDDIAPPTERDLALTAAMDWDSARQLDEAGLHSFLGGVDGVDALNHLLFRPGVTVCGFSAGYQGEGPKAVIPHTASAKVEFRIVPDQTPQRVLAQLRSHLVAHGFEDIDVAVHALVETAQTDPDAEVVAASAAAARQLYGEPLLKPTEEYAGRQGAWLGARLGIAGVQTGVGPPHNNGHAANEFVTEEHFIKGIKYAATIFHHFAAQGR